MTAAAVLAVTEIPLDLIDAGDNHRKVFTEADLDGLAESIRNVGVLQAVVVQTVGDRFRLIAGERRTRAARLAGLTTIPAVIRDDLDEEDAELVMLVENVQRADLNPMEEADGFRQIMARYDLSVEQLADRTGLKPFRIRWRLDLHRLGATARHLIGTGQMTPGFGRSMRDLSESRQEAACAAFAKKPSMTLVQFQRIVDKLMADQSNASIFDDFEMVTVDVDDLVSEAGQQSSRADLFDLIGRLADAVDVDAHPALVAEARSHLHARLGANY